MPLGIKLNSGEEVRIGDDITIKVVGINGKTHAGFLTLLISAPRDKKIVRSELAPK